MRCQNFVPFHGLQEMRTWHAAQMDLETYVPNFKTNAAKDMHTHFKTYETITGDNTYTCPQTYGNKAQKTCPQKAPEPCHYLAAIAPASAAEFLDRMESGHDAEKEADHCHLLRDAWAWRMARDHAKVTGVWSAKRMVGLTNGLCCNITYDKTGKSHTVSFELEVVVGDSGMMTKHMSMSTGSCA